MSTQPISSRPFDYVYVAPDVAPIVAELAYSPRVVAGPDGALLLYTSDETGEHDDGERVVAIDRFPPYALVHVLDDGPRDEPSASPALIGYLLRLDALP